MNGRANEIQLSMVTCEMMMKEDDYIIEALERLLKETNPAEWKNYQEAVLKLETDDF